MHIVCRWLMISLLILTLPLRGQAAAGHGGCHPGHIDGRPAVHAHGTAHHVRQAVVGEELVDAEQLAQSLKCTQCAPCCAAAAPPQETVCVLVAAGGEDVKDAVPLLALGDRSDRLERPPRHAAR